jgi:hypothetical protein
MWQKTGWYNNESQNQATKTRKAFETPCIYFVARGRVRVLYTPSELAKRLAHNEDSWDCWLTKKPFQKGVIFVRL